MSKDNLNRDEEQQALKEFLLDIKSLESVKAYSEKLNIFDILGIARMEIRHSFFLKWLLDPKENHGLGDVFIKKLIACLVSSDPRRYENCTFDLLMMDCSDFSVQREVKDIDLFLLSESEHLAIIIENKIGAHEHSSTGFDSQLGKYQKYVENTYGEGWRKIYVYLTPQNESPSSEDWQTLSYDEILEIIESIHRENEDRIPPEAKLLIQNYIDILRRDIVQDNELNKICSEIYEKHSKALELIFKHSKAGMRPILRTVTEALTEMANEGKIEYTEKERENFHTPRMTEFLPKLDEAKSSWKTEYPYYYWFKIDEEDERIALVFELGFHGIDEEIRAKMNGFINTRNPKNKTESTKYKRVESFNWEKLKNLGDDERKAIVKRIVGKVLEKEETWIKECENYLARN